MLSLPKQPDDDEMYDGCPVIRISDTAKDLSNLLRIFYDYAAKLDWRCPDMLISALRLSTKYLIEELRTSTLEILSQEFPSSLEQWNDRHDRISTLRHGWHQIIAVALETNADHLLPAAYYVLTQFESNYIIGLCLPRNVLDTFILGRERLYVAFPLCLAHFLGYCKPAARCKRVPCELGFMALQGRVRTKLIDPPPSTGSPTLYTIRLLTKCDQIANACMPCKETF
ncbi:hypothetical protein K439DRAFT_1405782 [Ramaria rubella]|nr:hypothetical protein K439DRAFT_1405782 [Ramaria rubella]